METVYQISVEESLKEQQDYFQSGATRSYSFRIAQLKKLKNIIQEYEERISKALWEDLHKSTEESYLTEISIVLQEIDNHIKHLKKWMKPKRVPTPLHLFSSNGKIQPEPLGVSLIVSPWNYPFQLLINPLVGAISAGCCAVLKPSPYTPSIAAVMEEMIRKTYEPSYITMFQGGRDVNSKLFAAPFDLVFYTGSPEVGKIVMKAAAENLTPVILELGGKSPCVVEKDADLDIAARRIAWGKTINAGQTCIAPDYLFVHQSVKEELLDKIANQIKQMHGMGLKESPYFSRIVNDRAMTRLHGLMQEGTIHSGGDIDYEQRYISPTIIDNVEPEHPIMQEEIFGPLLPVMTFEAIDEVVSYVNKNPKPLAFYYFGLPKKGKKLLSLIPSGGACINDTLMHIANHHLPFGGVGGSGMGKYHGKESFFAFSNRRAVVTTSTRLDLPFRYVPYKLFKLVRKIL